MIMGIGGDVKWKFTKKAGEKGFLNTDFQPLGSDKTLVSNSYCNIPLATASVSHSITSESLNCCHFSENSSPFIGRARHLSWVCSCILIFSTSAQCGTLHHVWISVVWCSVCTGQSFQYQGLCVKIFLKKSLVN